MVYKIKCEICGKEFISNDCKYDETARASVSKKLKPHIKEEHGLSMQEYIDNVYYNGIRPTCACGCGKPVPFAEKNCLYNLPTYGYRKYYHCSHVRKSQEFKDKHLVNNYVSKFDDITWLKQHYDDVYGWDNIENAAKDFLSGEFNNEDIEKKYIIDRRTIRKIWFKFGLVTEEQYKELAKKNQFITSAKHRRIIFENSEEVCAKLYNIIKNFPLKYNINSLIKEYNKNNILQIEQSNDIVLDKMYEYYGEELYDLLQFGYHSKEELNFLNILKFYFGKSNIKCGKKLKYGNNDREIYIYDICINDKILIEYDSTGFWHNSESRKQLDKEKEKFALDNNYIFMRVSLEYSKNPELIIKLKKLLETI